MQQISALQSFRIIFIPAASMLPSTPPTPPPNIIRHPRKKEKKEGRERREKSNASRKEREAVGLVEKAGLKSDSECRKTEEWELPELEESSEQDSSFEFSEEIMLKSQGKESREQRQRNKLNHLMVFDWMSRTSTLLKLTKQTLYRAVLILKKFVFLEQKTPLSKVTLSNVNLYALAGLLISNKLEQLGGNFLNNIARVVGSAGCGELSKQSILQCEAEIMRILNYRIPNSSYIIEATLKIIDHWDRIAESKGMGELLLGVVDLQQDQKQPLPTPQSEQLFDDEPLRQYPYLRQIFLYLIDSILLRKLVELKIKELHQTETPHFFIKGILNILYHLMHYCIKNDPQHTKAKLLHYNACFHQLIHDLEVPIQQRKTFLRKSHFLKKQIRAIFENKHSRADQLESVKQRNYFLLRCHRRRNDLRFQQARKFSISQNIEASVTKREDEHETNAVVDDLPPSVLKEAETERKPVPNDRRANLSETSLLRFLLNSHFHIGLIATKQRA